MRMFRFSSWISESRGGDETVHGHNKLAGMEQPLDDARDYSVQPVGATKRKLGNRDAPPLSVSACAAAAKRKKECDMGAGLSAPQAGKMEATTVPNRSKPGALARMREVIDHQLSLEVLMKHDELRRIDQELAKATVALDQLRRCHLIPFPVSLGSPEAMLTVSTGTGPSIPQARRTQPRMAAPFGVTEGPYSRHYASWLIPDPGFDGVQTGWGMLPGAAAGNNTVPGRTTRNSLALEMPAAKPRRGAASSKKLQALPSGYPPPKETAGPLVLKRADGQWVKLVCLVCQRENFGSTQGFINHCRIAHHREFKSHEEAASQSGQPVEVDSVTGGIVGGESKPAAPTTTTPTGSSTLVHPLIRSAPYDRQTVNTLLERISEGTRMFYEGKLPGITAIPSVKPAAPSRKRSEPHDGFVPSDSAPCLSRLLHRRGFGQNLDQLVEDAKTPSKRRRVVGTDGVSDSASDSDSEFEVDAVELVVLPEDAPVNSQVGAAVADTAAALACTPQPQRHAPILPPGFARPGSSKGPSTTLRRPGMMPSNLYATPGSPPTPASQLLRLPLMGPYGTISASSDDADVDVDAANLSPATASNKAPSLISDDGEYSYVEDGESSGAEESVEGGDGEEGEEVEIEEVEEGGGMVRTGKGEVGFVRAVKGGK
ncbi:hypothetical protein VC83_08579 [Pseudogymnoascus destructans]|uniref:AHC1-like C2H2 zinc-finger domain-containing protein n=2 Tax=Pseudogymnoascus destructans TaxID=655981 RepID=L8G2V3_PSED2|nr:uncharacterized protein VC83_08579 [Pseudogymnoascus destructans]ELR06321.1 hypothetical protein GMDG_07912 [Pseudogymnoascus destructans 20631-21]OAF54992.1 hypothetical protein VC83_08579 [Pseudogymnoascus destructans]